MNSEYFLKLDDPEIEQLTAKLNFQTDEIDGTKLKLEINEIVWRNAAETITLKEAEDIAIPFWNAIMETHNR